MPKVATKFLRAFGNLSVRRKLMVLHNGYFLILSVAVYLAIVPWLAGRLAEPSPGLSSQIVDEVTRRLLVVLGLTYTLAVLILEGFVMPFYIYRPLKAVLEADRASRRGDRDHELVSLEWIQDDELGQLLASRNATLQALREREAELERALRELERTTADLRRKNELLEAAKEKLVQQDRLASLGLLSASVAHELNTPLAVLQGTLERLLETTANSSLREQLERLLRVTQRLGATSRMLLEFSHQRPSAREPVPLTDILQEAWELVSLDELATRVRFVNACPPGVRITGHRARLVQLFVNLLRNAVYASPPGGQVTIRCNPGQPGPGFLTIAVEDQGPGFPEDILPKAFEAFITTRLDARGTGLGLAIAEGIVHEHGGSIRAINRPEGGARLEVVLPQQTPPEPAP